VKRSGCAALPLGLAFAEALHFRLKFQRKLRPFPALCKEEAPNLRVIDFFGGLRESVFAVAARLDQVFQDIDSIIDVGHDFSSGELSCCVAAALGLERLNLG